MGLKFQEEIVQLLTISDSDEIASYVVIEKSVIFRNNVRNSDFQVRMSLKIFRKL